MSKYGEMKKLPYTQALEWSELLRLIDKGARPEQPGEINCDQMWPTCSSFS